MKVDLALIDKLEWGDYVRVLDNAPRKYRTIKYGIICSTRVIENEETASQTGETIGTILYLIESSDGDSLEIPDRYLEKN